MKFIYAFDFDGVLVDSANELGLSGFDAAKMLFPGAPWLTRRLRRPDQLQELVDKFHLVRPCLETGWEAPILIYLLTKGNVSVQTILQNFQHGLLEETMKELNVSKEQCNDALKKARNTWIESDDNGQDWLECHGFYEGACDAVRKLLEQEDKLPHVYVITTKAAVFTRRLLEQQRLAGKDAPGGGIPDERIFGLGSPPKPKVLANLLHERGDDFGAVFVEDRFLTLESTMADTTINQRVLPVLASWGYATKEHIDSSKEAGFVVLDKDDPSSLGYVLDDNSASKLLKELNGGRIAHHTSKKIRGVFPQVKGWLVGMMMIVLLSGKPQLAYGFSSSRPTQNSGSVQPHSFLGTKCSTTVTAGARYRPQQPTTDGATRRSRTSNRSSTRLFNLLDDILGAVNNIQQQPSTSTPTKANNNFNLQQEMSDQSSILLGLELALEELQTVLANKKAQLEQQQDTWSQEKTGLVAQIAALTSNLKLERDALTVSAEDQEVEAEIQVEYQQEQDRLQREIKLLEYQKQQVEERLQAEKERNEELQQRLSKTNDALEFEQMMFFKEQQKLKQQIDDQQSQLNKVQNRLKREEEKFGDAQEELKAQLQQEQARLAQKQAEIKQLQQEYQQGQQVLQDKVKQEEQALQQARRQLEQNRSQSQQDRNRLQTQIETTIARVVGLEDAIENEEAQFNSIKPFLEQTIQEEKAKVEELSRNLQQEQESFATQKNSLEDRIAAEQERLSKVETQLQQERTNHEQTKKQLAYEQALIDVKRADDRQRMGQRYTALRAAMTARIQEIKKQGREDIKQLTERYTAQLALTQDAIDKMQEQVEVTAQSRDNLQIMIKDMKAQVEQVYQEKQEQEIRYKRLLVDRDLEITKLRTNIKILQAKRQERQEQVEKLETSLREIAKSSLQLTGRRLTKVNPLRLVFRKGDGTDKNNKNE